MLNKNIRFWKNKKVFITGHSGFKGTWLSLTLNILGANIVGYSDKRKNNIFFNNLKLRNFKNIYGDVRNYDKLKKSINIFKPDIIFHLAAQSLVIEGYSNPKITYDTNCIGTINILEIASKLKSLKSIFIITSDKVYENLKKNNFKENDKLGGDDPYSNSKAAADIIAQGYFNFLFSKKNIGLGIIRAGNVYGGGDFNQDRLIPDVIKSIYLKRKLTIRNGNHIRPWQHILDCTYKYIILSERIYSNPKKYSGLWNIGSKNEKKISVIKLVSLMKKFKTFKYNVNKKKSSLEKNYLKINTKKFNKIFKNNDLTIIKGLKITFDWFDAFFSKKDIQKVSISQISEYLNKK